MDFLSRRLSRLNVDININGQVQGSVPSYTTFDKIEGEVVIRAEKDVQFDHVVICFEGMTKTTLMRQSPMAHVSNNINASQCFLRLRQPIEQSAYPEPREFKSQQLYKFPFTFVVPDRLLPQSCSHFTNNPHVKAAHMQLPPSFGDAMVCDSGKALLDDMAPIMSEIGYKIKASVVQRNTTTATTAGDKPLYLLSSIGKKVRIIPATIEQPPLEIECNCNADYRTRREKHVRKTLLGGKTGRLVVTAAQPRPLQLPARGTANDAGEVSSSYVKLHVRFDPENDDEQPPRLKSLLTRLKVVTYASVKPWTSFPSKNITTVYDKMNQSHCTVYTETLGLSSLCVASAPWKKYDGTGPNDSARNSLETNGSDDSSIYQLASPSYSGKSFYTASILIPVSLPTNKAFVPTFHTCLVSRIYSLDLSLTYQSKPLTPRISLNIPIQITSAPGNGISPDEDISTPMMLPETQIEDEYYRPRNITPPSENDYLDRYQLLTDSSADVYSSSSSSSSSFSPSNSVLLLDSENAPPEYSAVPPSRVRTSDPLSPAWAIRALY
ncbi:hypothetical protein UA08_03311 [Talaromyces atroroseus]|uniref:Arrestin-like N-terminal domain-containing protein n=1 Tax=Talaromyces atroroseus TaxID=1441469 RepID=A0A225B2P3_TALAT|nr:hypothetical protein UA08_03311 [Talaromyces atroroseus]OKL61536.1 hypothetical protein UA08_03311 [Talaromyces atroroseus]